MVGGARIKRKIIYLSIYLPTISSPLSLSPFLPISLHIYLCRREGVFVLHIELIEMEGKLIGVVSLLPACGFQGWNSVQPSGLSHWSKAGCFIAFCVFAWGHLW